MRILRKTSCFGALLLVLCTCGLRGAAQDLFIQDSGIKLVFLCEIKELAWAMGSEAEILIHQKKLYIPLGYPGLSVYDISDPKSPQHVVRIHSNELGGQAGPLAASGNRLFVALPDQKNIIMMDVSDPSVPVEMERFGQIPQILHLDVAGQNLFAHSQSTFSYLGGFYVFNIAGNSPQISGEYLTNLIDPGFFVTDTGHVFLARTPADMNDSAKIDSIDMSNPTHPVLIDQWETTYPGNVTDIHLQGGKIYCSAYWGGIWILNAADYSALSLDKYFDWVDRASTALSVKAYPPLIFAVQGGPDWEYRKFVVYRDRGDLLVSELEIPIPDGQFAQSVHLKNNLLILVHNESPWLTNQPYKTLKLYRIQMGKPGLTVSASDGGTTIPAPGIYHFEEATSVTITAVPDPDYSFDRWSGDASGRDNPLILYVDVMTSVKANFLREIYAPVNVAGTRKENRSLFLKEFVNVLTWQNNSGNEKITKFRIYEFLQSTRILLGETDSQTRTYWHRGVEGHRSYTYAIAAVNEEGREGRAAIVTID